MCASNLTPEEEFRLTGSVSGQNAEELLDVVPELEEAKEYLLALSHRNDKAKGWIADFMKLKEVQELNQKSLDFLITALNTLGDD